MVEGALAGEAEPGREPKAGGHARSPRTLLQWFRIVAGTNLMVLILNFVTGAISARVLGPAGKGVFAAVNVWTNVFGGLAAMGIHSAFVSMYARARPEDRPGIARALLLLACFWGVAGSVAVYVVSPHLLQHLAPRAAAWARFSSPLVAIYVICHVGGAYLNVEKKFGLPNWTNLARTLAYTVLVVGLAAWGLLTPYTQMATSWILISAGMILTLIVGMRALPLRRGPVRLRVVWQLSVLGWRYFGLSLLGMFNSQLDQMIASAWLSAGDMGLYAIAISSLNIVGMLQGAVGSIMFPWVAGDSQESVIDRTARVARRMSLLLVLTVVFVCACSWPFVLIVYGRSYLPAVKVVLLIAPTAAFTGAITVLYQAFYALRWFVGPTLGEGVGAVSGAILLWLLIPRWGLDGAAVATTVSYALDLVVVVWSWVRMSSLPVGALVPRRGDVHFVLGQAMQVPSRLLRGALG